MTSALERMDDLTRALARDLFPTLRPPRVCWHGADHPVLGSCTRDGRLISLKQDIERLPRSWCCQVITHELAHAVTVNESRAGIDHGPRWRSAMLRAGIDVRGYGAISGALVPAGPLDRWIKERGW